MSMQQPPAPTPDDVDRLRREHRRHGEQLERIRSDTREAAARLAMLERGGVQDRDLRELRAERELLRHEVSTAAERAAQAGEQKALSHLRLLKAEVDADRARSEAAGRPPFGAGALQLEAQSTYGSDVSLDKRETWQPAAARHGQREAERLSRQLEEQDRR